MKKFLLISICTALFLPLAWSQTEKGVYMLGGSTNLLGGYSGIQPNQLALGFGNSSSDVFDYKYTNINIASNGGFFVADGLMLGLNIGIFYNKSTSEINYPDPIPDEEIDTKFTNLTLTPLVRYYLNGGNKLQYFGEARAGVALQKLDDNDADNQLLFGGKVGIAYFLNNKVAVDVFFDYTGGASESEVNGVSVKEFDSFLGFGVAFDVFW